MKENFVAIALVVDKSGSMHFVQDDTIGGINSFIEQNREEALGETRFTLAQFNSNYKITKDFVDIKDVKKLSRNNYRPTGGTALLDAIGKTIDELGSKLSAMDEDERPSKVIVAVITDGEENASRKYTQDQVRSMIKRQEEVYNWSVLFLGSELNTADVAQSYGINAGNTMTYQKGNIDSAFTSMATSSLRGARGLSTCFTEEERASNS
jgi:uncharacterized protein YegL